MRVGLSVTLSLLCTVREDFFENQRLLKLGIKLARRAGVHNPEVTG